ncbi:WD repeat-containing protein on Y chromosome-like [Pseudoliparis swirei]|uniref:WD repeat-containing protein on Y chromosome-like n=1 Tax=Pseudoliparis swirei TaxID=2059687 RepID=UPI0024BD6EFA|nr:WD repeat-containing protein on Y chromosome-like [Pseudoliparis swirei]
MLPEEGSNCHKDKLKISEIEELFHQVDVDSGGGLDIEEFQEGMKDFFYDEIKDISAQKEELRTYQEGQYISITTDGVFSYWSDTFENRLEIFLNKKTKSIKLSHKKMKVNGMAYIKELKQVAVASSEGKVLFYSFHELPTLFEIKHALIVEDFNAVCAINYSSNGTKGVLSFGNEQGHLYVLVSENINTNGLFSPDSFEKISKEDYPTLYVSTLLKKNSKQFQCSKTHIFKDIFTEIKYFPAIESLGICGRTSKIMVIAAMPESHRGRFTKTVFESPANKEFFTCVEYSPLNQSLLTGGTDGLLREWYVFKPKVCKKSLKGQGKPITHIEYNPKDEYFVTLSKDKTICLWSERSLLLLESFQVEDMNITPIATLCYNNYNNELVLANTDIGTSLGRGTDAFHNALLSHDKPLCSALYHSIYNQMVSVCRDGMVKVWDILTGKLELKFKLTPDKHVGHSFIAFDGPKRRLITSSQDGKLRLWNFSSATLLEVLPVTLPEEVTGIVTYDNRLFVSIRNSKIIYDLDMDGESNNFLSHPYLEDISSMDVHENTLITASSNGYIAIWNVDEKEVICLINESKSPRIHMPGRKEKGVTGCLVNGGKERRSRKKPSTKMKAKPLILCLKEREFNVYTATLLTSADGYICAWSVNVNGGLLGKFRAVDKEGAFITTMTTDINEKILLTGDSTGKICQWDIHTFCSTKATTKGPFQVLHGWHTSLAQPPLLGSWKCHDTEVVSVNFDISGKEIITAGDSHLQLWKNKGSHIGLFGKDFWEEADQVEADQVEADQTQLKPQKPPLMRVYLKEIPLKAEPFPPMPRASQIVTRPLPKNVKKLFYKAPKTTQVPIEILFKDELEKRQKDSVLKPCYPIPLKATVVFPGLPVPQSKVKQPPAKVSEHVLFSNDKLIEGGADLKQSSPQTLNQTRSKYGRVLKNQQADTIKDNVLTPRPPSTLKATKISVLPNMNKLQIQRVQLTTNQRLNQTRSKYGRVLKNQQADTIKDSVLTPRPPSTLKATEIISVLPNMNKLQIQVALT